MLTKLRTINSNLEKENTENEEDKKEKSFENTEKVEVVAAIIQNTPEVEVGERTHVESMKDSTFNIENLQYLFNSSIFDTSVKIAYGLGPIHGEPSTFSIPFPQFPSHSSTIEPSKVQEEVPHVRIRSPPPIVKPPSRSV